MYLLNLSPVGLDFHQVQWNSFLVIVIISYTFNSNWFGWNDLICMLLFIAMEQGIEVCVISGSEKVGDAL